MSNGESKVSLTIDGRKVTVPAGMLIIEAAAQAGINIPRFCYQKLLKPYAGCRMCLVEIPKGSDKDPRPFPKPQPSCATPVQEGMEVVTNSRAVRELREGIMEFTLINHPLDCPICDKGGECDLQDLALLFGREESRFLETKIFSRHHKISSLITLDYNRCILCKRCVRWTEEVADDDRLVLHDRGAHTKITAFHNEQFRSRFGGMTIELCPVGALTSNVFRFKARSWEVASVDSSCTECSLGCSFTAQFRNDRIMRFMSKENDRINREFFCDRGRFAHDWLDHPDRLMQPMARLGGKFARVGWDDAVSIFVDNCKRTVQNHGPRALAACTDPSEPLESLWCFRRLFRDVLGTVRIEHAPTALGLDPDDFPGVFARLAKIDDVLTGKNIVFWGSDPLDEAPVLGLRMKLALKKGAIDGISVSPVSTYLGAKGMKEHIVPPHRARILLADITRSLADRVANPPDAFKPTIEQARTLAANIRPELKQIAEEVTNRLLAPDAVLVLGGPVLRARRTEIVALLLVTQLREALTGAHLPILPMFREANSLAAMLLGLRTQLKEGPEGPMQVGFTGESAYEWPGEVEGGKIRAVFTVGDGLFETIGTAGLRKLETLDFLAVATDFVNPFVNWGDLIIPRTAPWEMSGTYITLEGRVIRTEPVVRNPAGAWDLSRFFSEAARELGGNIPPTSREIIGELAKSNPNFAGLLNDETEFLDRPAKAGMRLGESGIAFKKLEPPEAGTFRPILTETIFRHDSRGLHAPNVRGMPEEFCVGIDSQDASALGIRAGAYVRVVSEHGGVDAHVKILDLPKGYLLVPVGFRDYPINDLGALFDPETRLGVLAF
jgi:NADH-quinone oxidoreductase subunit G